MTPFLTLCDLLERGWSVDDELVKETMERCRLNVEELRTFIIKEDG